MISEELTQVITIVRAHKGLPPLEELYPEMRLRQDVGFESLDLAELTVRIEEKFDVDVFADGLVFTIGEIEERIEKSTKLK